MPVSRSRPNGQPTAPARGWLVAFERRSGQPPLATRTGATLVTSPAGRGLPLDPATMAETGDHAAPPGGAPAWAQIRYLLPFDQTRIEAFVANWYRQRCGSDTEARGLFQGLRRLLPLREAGYAAIVAAAGVRPA